PNQVLRPVHRLVADPRLRHGPEGNAAFEREVVSLKATLDIGEREPLRQLKCADRIKLASSLFEHVHTGNGRSGVLQDRLQEVWCQPGLIRSAVSNTILRAELLNCAPLRVR